MTENTKIRMPQLAQQMQHIIGSCLTHLSMSNVKSPIFSAIIAILIDNISHNFREEKGKQLGDMRDELESCKNALNKLKHEVSQWKQSFENLNG